MMGGMGSLRAISRQAHSEKWVERKRFRTLRRLSQQALRAKGRGDEESMGRLSQILNRIAPSLFTDEVASDAAPAENPIFQKTVPPGQKEKGGNFPTQSVTSKGRNKSTRKQGDK